MKQFVRVAGIVIRDGAVLTHRAMAPDGAYYALPGGHLETGETTQACLVREFAEEFAVAIEVGRLMYIAEGLYTGGRKAKRKHEIVFYYRAHLVDAQAVVHSQEEPRIYAHWLPLDGSLERLVPHWLQQQVSTDAANDWTGPTLHIIADALTGQSETLQITPLQSSSGGNSMSSG